MKRWMIFLYLIVLVGSVIGTANASLQRMTESWQLTNQAELTEVKKAEVRAKMAMMQIP